MKIKICGITRLEETEYLNRNHVDFAGFVMFFPKSKRNITPEQAATLLPALNSQIKKVAVTVSPSLEEVLQIEELGFDYIQIHGTLSDEVLNGSSIPVLKAFNVSDMEQYAYYHTCSRIVGYVFDALEPGSGKTFDWKLVNDIPRDEKMLLIFLLEIQVFQALPYLTSRLSLSLTIQAIIRITPSFTDIQVLLAI